MLSLVVTPRRRAAPCSTWCCATSSRRSAPTTCSSGLTSVHGLELVGVPLLTRLAQGPLDPDTGEIGDPLRAA